ncbi:DUF3667 domain-containing protein [Thermomonas sp. HDW16]|uniref:DUF3667 domain-containing protein n=1 Tax=Thermomonas sp. HDW16 TaxID=2714945 RepID=UPI00140AADEA|nr:DUF3667 domain-containing protein [Thermomonas sp. HDW16]QIL19329.1 DUF3667 domain-containing protein [Thermomonas sp. HDW16]
MTEQTTNTEATPTAAAGDCRNCGTPLLGAHCYACGQPVKGLVRPLGNLFGDLLDSVFNIDTRILRTLPPLFAKPGFLSTEYFAGRQVRYVTPVRLFFFLAIVTFFLAQLSFQIGPDAIDVDGKGSNGNIRDASTVAEVEKRRDVALAGLADAKKGMAGTPAASGIPGIEAGEQKVREEANARIKQLQEAQAKGEPVPEADENKLNLSINGKRWDAKKNPVDTWLPSFANRWLNDQIVRGNRNIERLKQDPSAFKDAVLSAVPTTLFVLVPIFALMLKLAYLLKRRLYMEHVVVALHSHAFLCLDLLLVLLVRMLQEWLAPNGGALATLFGWIEGLLIAWMPIYLLLMQKRVYAQGWPMTLLKYCVLGFCYTILLSFAIAASMAIGLVAM